MLFKITIQITIDIQVIISLKSSEWQYNTGELELIGINMTMPDYGIGKYNTIPRSGNRSKQKQKQQQII